MALEIESVTIGWVQKVEFFMPENASNYLDFLADPFDLTTRPIGQFYVRKRRENQLLEEPKPTENPAKLDTPLKGYDSLANEKYEKLEAKVEVVESGTEATNDNKQEMSEADYWNQEDQAEWMKHARPNKPKKLGLARWSVYKSIAVLAQT